MIIMEVIRARYPHPRTYEGVAPCLPDHYCMDGACVLMAETLAPDTDVAHSGLSERGGTDRCPACLRPAPSRGPSGSLHRDHDGLPGAISKFFMGRRRLLLLPGGVL